MSFSPSILTHRQRSVYKLLAKDHSIHSIAKQLGLHPDNVRSAEKEIEAARRHADNPVPIDPTILGPRMRQVYELMQQGFSARDIADGLDIALRSAQTYCTDLRRMQRNGGPGLGEEKARLIRAEAIDKRLAALPVCDVCSLRGDHECIGRAADVAHYQRFDPCDL